MATLYTPVPIRELADRFKSCADVSFGALSALLYGSFCGEETLADIVRNSPWAPSVSALSRELKQFSSAKVLLRMRASLLRRLGNKLSPERFCFAVDDTIVSRFGDTLHGVGYQRPHGKSGAIRGQRVMVISLVDMDRGIAHPLNFAMCFNVGAVGYVNGHELCLRLVKEIVAEGFPELVTVADSWFDSVGLLEKFDSEGLSLVVEAKSNRQVKVTASSKEPWKNWKDLLHKKIKCGVKLPKSLRAKRQKKTKYIAQRRVRLKGRSVQIISCAVYNKPSDGKPFAIYISNNLSLTGADLWQYSRARWRIEEAFRILKQNLGFLKLPVSGKEACEATIAIPFVILAEVYLEPERWGGHSKMSVGQILTIFQENENWKMFDELSKGTTRPTLQLLRARRSLNQNKNKPVNSTANRFGVRLKCA